MTALIAYFFMALVISFICSLLESVLLSVSHAHIAVLIKEGKNRGSIMASLKENINNSKLRASGGFLCISFWKLAKSLFPGNMKS